MKNSKKSEKSRGVVVFAFNNRHVNYVSIADQTSRLISKNLGLPITLITDEYSTDPDFDYDEIIVVESKSGNTRRKKDGSGVQEWKNFDRYCVYDLSPYDETLLLDTDYLVLDQSLLKLFEQPFDYRLMYHMQTPKELNRDEMGPISLPMVWATVVLFRKTEISRMYFDLIGRIQRNYGYYRALYGIRDSNFRNDFAFSIANIVLNGHAVDPTISVPWPMTTIEPDIENIEIRNGFLVVRYDVRADVISRQNLHIMDKNYLTSDQFERLVDEVCDEG
jgi:hypothetical protein